MRVVIEMEIRSRRYLAPRWLASPAARAGRVIGRLMRPWQRVVPLAAAVFLAAGVLAVSGPLPAASAATQPVPPGLGGRNWTAIPTHAKVVALTFDAGANADGVQSILGHAGQVPRPGDVLPHRELRPGFPGPVQGDRSRRLPDR